MKKYILNVKEGLKKDIDLSKLGIVFRKLNEEEKKNLLDCYNKIVLKGQYREMAVEYHNINNATLDNQIKLLRKMNNGLTP